MAKQEPTRLALDERTQERLADMAQRFGETREWVIEQLVLVATIDGPCGWNKHMILGSEHPAPYHLRDDGEPVEIVWVEALGCWVADYDQKYATKTGASV